MKVRPFVALLAMTLSSCASNPEARKPHEPTTDSDPNPGEVAVGPVRALELTRLEQLRVGMRPGLKGAADLPSTAADIDALGQRLGLSFGCEAHDGWESDEDGVLLGMCGAEDVAVGEATVWLRFHLMRFEFPPEDGIGRLHRIEIVPPLAETSPGYRTYAGPRPAWSAAMRATADQAYGQPAQSETTDAEHAVWRRRDRYISLHTPRGPEGVAALLHFGLDDLDRHLFGVTP